MFCLKCQTEMNKNFACGTHTHASLQRVIIDQPAQVKSPRKKIIKFSKD